jgi:hypothetical protein
MSSLYQLCVNGTVMFSVHIYVFRVQWVISRWSNYGNVRPIYSPHDPRNPILVVKSEKGS